MWHTEITLRWKIICLNEVYKFSAGNFLTRCIFYVLVSKKQYWKSKIPFFNQKMLYKISVKLKNRLLKNSLRIFFLFEIFGRRLISFNHVNDYKVTEMHIENRAQVSWWECVP